MINTRAVAVFSYGYIPEISSINLGFPWVLTKKKFVKRNPSGRSKNPRVQFLAPPTLHKDPASKTKAKTLTILNRSRCAEITFEWTGGCKMTC